MFKRNFNLLVCSKNGSLLRDSVRTFVFERLKVSLYKFMQSQYKAIRPPYSHICQIGDPVLRARAEPVDLEIIPTPEFKWFVKHLFKTMRKYGAYGLAAPQIGTPYQVFVMETNEDQLDDEEELKRAGQPVDIVPERVFINPKMKIIDYTTLTFPENCGSVCGLSALVPRAKSVEIEALDLDGKTFVWKAEGWPARIAQHEMDHLQGTLFTDKMEPKTLSCSIWDVVNMKRGKVEIKFYPQSQTVAILRKFLYR